VEKTRLSGGVEKKSRRKQATAVKRQRTRRDKFGHLKRHEMDLTENILKNGNRDRGRGDRD